MSSGSINYRNDILHKHAEDFLKSPNEREIDEYSKIAYSILSEIEQAQATGASSPFDTATIKQVKENQLAITRIRNRFLSDKHITDLSKKSVEEIIPGLSIKEIEQYIDVATALID